MGSALSTFSSFEATRCLIERKTGQRVSEPTPFSKSLRTWLLYNTWIGRLLMLLPVTWWLLTLEHKRIASYANSPKLRGKIKAMIKAYRIEVNDADKPVGAYRTLQEFFTRELKEGARPIAEPG